MSNDLPSVSFKGVLCRLKNEAEGPVKVHFKAVPKTLEISGFGSLDAALVNQVNIKDGEMEVIRNDEPHNWNSEVSIVKYMDYAICI